MLLLCPVRILIALFCNLHGARSSSLTWTWFVSQSVKQEWLIHTYNANVSVLFFKSDSIKFPNSLGHVKESTWNKTKKRRYAVLQSTQSFTTIRTFKTYLHYFLVTVMWLSRLKCRNLPFARCCSSEEDATFVLSYKQWSTIRSIIWHV
jgi:hypothetical protein